MTMLQPNQTSPQPHRTPDTPSGGEQTAAKERIGVLFVGPPLERIGGMVSVIRQMMQLPLANRYRVEHLGTTHAPGHREQLPSRIYRHLRQVVLLRRTAARTDARLVHLHTCSGFTFYRSVLDMLLLGRSKYRTILHVHGGGFHDFFQQSGRWGQRIITRALTRADAVVALSDSWRKILRSMAPKARVVVVENAVTKPTGQTGVTRQESDRRCHFLMLGPLDASKGVDDALHSAQALQQRGVAFRMTLAGPAGDFGNADSMPDILAARGLTDCVQYVGTVTGDAKDALFADADVLLQPSHVEGMPMSMLEALSFGLPVVGARVGAIPEVIQDGIQGLLVPPRSREALTEAMTQLIKDPARRVNMRIEALALSQERFGSRRLSRDLVGLYDAVLGEPRSAPVADVAYPVAVHGPDAYLPDQIVGH